jgi:hypothetical protein
MYIIIIIIIIIIITALCKCAGMVHMKHDIILGVKFKINSPILRYRKNVR